MNNSKNAKQYRQKQVERKEQAYKKISENSVKIYNEYRSIETKIETLEKYLKNNKRSENKSFYDICTTEKMILINLFSKLKEIIE